MTSSRRRKIQQNEFLQHLERNLKKCNGTSTGVKTLDSKIKREIEIGDRVQDTRSFQYGKVTKVVDDSAIVTGIGKIPTYRLIRA